MKKWKEILPTLACGGTGRKCLRLRAGFGTLSLMWAFFLPQCFNDVVSGLARSCVVISFFFSASAPVTGSFVSEFKYAGEIYCRVWERGTRKVHPDQQKSLSLVRMRQDFLLTALQGAVSKLVAEPLGFKIISCATGNICRHSFLESFSLKVCWVQPTQKRCQVMMTSVYFSKILIYARQRRPL